MFKTSINFVNVCSNGKFTRQNNGKRLVVQRQIFINKIHVWQVESYAQPFLNVTFTIYYIKNSLLYVPIRKVLLNSL